MRLGDNGQSDPIAFFSVENDGLGAQHRATEKNNLAQVYAELVSSLNALRHGACRTKGTAVDFDATSPTVFSVKGAAPGSYGLRPWRSSRANGPDNSSAKSHGAAKRDERSASWDIDRCRG
jgi:type I restriction enzyme M protein